MAFLYFVNLSDGDDGCPASELYADTLEILTVRQAWPGYWYRCRQLPERPTSQARQVVEEALAGEMPSWFADHYGMNGSWDYEAIWADVNRLGGKERQAVIYNLRDHFGGYCDVATVGDLIDGQPWQDGGCPARPIKPLGIVQAKNRYLLFGIDYKLPSRHNVYIFSKSIWMTVGWY